MFYIYFIYSEKTDRFYIGHSNDPQRRVIEHNSTENNTFTKKSGPWVLAYYFAVSEARGEALKIERFIKKQKSRRLIERIIKEKLDIEHFKWIINK